MTEDQFSYDPRTQTEYKWDPSRLMWDVHSTRESRFTADVAKETSGPKAFLEGIVRGARAPAEAVGSLLPKGSLPTWLESAMQPDGAEQLYRQQVQESNPIANISGQIVPALAGGAGMMRAGGANLPGFLGSSAAAGGMYSPEDPLQGALIGLAAAGGLGLAGKAINKVRGVLPGAGDRAARIAAEQAARDGSVVDETASNIPNRFATTERLAARANEMGLPVPNAYREGGYWKGMAETVKGGAQKVANETDQVLTQKLTSSLGMPASSNVASTEFGNATRNIIKQGYDAAESKMSSVDKADIITALRSTADAVPADINPQIANNYIKRLEDSLPSTVSPSTMGDIAKKFGKLARTTAGNPSTGDATEQMIALNKITQDMMKKALPDAASREAFETTRQRWRLAQVFKGSAIGPRGKMNLPTIKTNMDRYFQPGSTTTPQVQNTLDSYRLAYEMSNPTPHTGIVGSMAGRAIKMAARQIPGIGGIIP